MSLGMDGSPHSDEAPILAIRLSPHRSLGPSGVRTLLGAAFVVGALFSLPFYLMGAWPIVGFLGLDVAALFIAFRVNFRAARAYEDFYLTYLELLFARASAHGARREWRFNPSWVRLERIDHEEFGPQRLSLLSRGRRWEIAKFLGPDQKAEFATTLTQALAEARRGPRFS
jgi:uncharacterized membrane protein